MLSSIGVPGLNGFAGEFLILIGSFLTARWWTVVAAAGVILAAALPAVGLPAGVPRRARRARTPRCATSGCTEGLVLAPLLGLIVFLGVYPKPVLERIEPSVDAAHRRTSRTQTGDDIQPDVAEEGPSRRRRRGRAPRTTEAGD